MKYFLHDTAAFEDEKIVELFDHFGYEGIGLFYTILEKIARQEKPIKTAVLKSQLRVGKRLEKCWSFMESLGIISSSDGQTFNERILSYSESYQIKKQKTREKIAEWREKHKDTKNVTSYETVSNPPKVKLSKVKVYKEKIQYRQNICLTEDENSKLVQLHGQQKADACYDFLSSYKIEKGYKTKSDYLTITRWVLEAVNKAAKGAAKNDYESQRAAALANYIPMSKVE